MHSHFSGLAALAVVAAVNATMHSIMRFMLLNPLLASTLINGRPALVVFKIAHGGSGSGRGDY